MLTNKRTDNKYSGRQTLHVYNVITLFLKLLHPYLLDEEDLQAHNPALDPADLRMSEVWKYSRMVAARSRRTCVEQH